ncbi:hypothetical protein [Allorhizobium taibaishanense]|uniref:Glycine zipper domain-containing protein n=1 Tax=Allorhizobium taibaishanense TaxID=887144 RepID=A0A1Q9A4F1_9HYPH|nr:hypothetical protein [Allorhizobium taibaishanense]MBB4006461.1 hypothetical protein [Allorhizobium taibaishanense]OLP49402.1 hypothetical protein BJF91_20375 [Allorhizobium taibaishanense]
MSVFRMSMSAGLVAALIGGSLMATAPAAEAHDRFWGGVAAGAVGGIVGSAIVNGMDGGPRYYRSYGPPPPPPPVYYRTYYRPVYVSPCHFERRYDEWGNSYRVQVCPR